MHGIRIKWDMDSESGTETALRGGELSQLCGAISGILTQGLHPSGPLFHYSSTQALPGSTWVLKEVLLYEYHKVYFWAKHRYAPESPVIWAQGMRDVRKDEGNSWKNPQEELVCSPDEGTEPQKGGVPSPRAKGWALQSKDTSLGHLSLMVRPWEMASLEMISPTQAKLINRRKQPHTKPPSGNFTP